MTTERLTDKELDFLLATARKEWVPADMARRAVEELAALRASRAAAPPDALAAFARDCAVNWDCDTGANGAHHHACRSCAAEKLSGAASPDREEGAPGSCRECSHPVHRPGKCAHVFGQGDECLCGADAEPAPSGEERRRPRASTRRWLMP